MIATKRLSWKLNFKTLPLAQQIVFFKEINPNICDTPLRPREANVAFAEAVIETEREILTFNLSLTRRLKSVFT